MAAFNRSDSSSARLQYLKDSSKLLLEPSPSTSAHLMSIHDQQMYGSMKPLPVGQKRDCCPSCGSIRMPDWPIRPYANKNKRGKQKMSTTKSPEETSLRMAYKCMRCHRLTVLPAARPATKPATASTPETTAAVSKAASENPGSRKKARAKKQQGLLAAVTAAKQRPQLATDSPSLNFLDILQQ